MGHLSELNKSIRLLFVLFGAIVLTETSTGVARSGFTVFTGMILIGLCLLSIILSVNTGRGLTKGFERD